MTVSNTLTLDAYAQIAQQSYEPLRTTLDVPGTNGSTYIDLEFDGLGDIDVPTIDGPWICYHTP